MQRRVCSPETRRPVIPILCSCGRVQSALIPSRRLRECALDGVGGGEIGRRVGAAAAVEAVRTRPARELVAAAAAAQTVVTSTAGQDVAAAVAAQQVVSALASQRVVVALG
jgi:hypothetical protein